MRKIIGSIVAICLPILFLGSQATAQTVTPSPSPEVTITPSIPSPTPTVVTLAVPQGITAVMISEDRIDISWKASTGASAYELYRNDELIAIVGSIFHKDTGLDAETSYSYKVRAYDGVSYSSYSTTVSATTGAAAANATPEPTIPLGPDDNKLKPSVQESHSFVTINDVKDDYNGIETLDPGDKFIVIGRTEDYADIEVVVESDPKSYFTKADDDGFWEVSIDTSILDEGEHTFAIIISTPDFPEKYESEKYSFSVNAKVEPTLAIVENTGFGSKVERVIFLLIVLVLVLFVSLLIVALKKGWFRRLKSPENKPNLGEGEVKSMDLNNLIQIESQEGKSVQEDQPATESVNNKIDGAATEVVNDAEMGTNEDIPSDFELPVATQNKDMAPKEQEKDELSSDDSPMEESFEGNGPNLSDEDVESTINSAGGINNEVESADVNEIVVDIEGENDPRPHTYIPNEVENSSSVLEQSEDESQAQVEGISGFEFGQEFLTEGTPQTEENSSEGGGIHPDVSENEYNREIKDDYSSTTSIQDRIEPTDIDQNAEEMVSKDGLYSGAAPRVAPSEPVI